jgi:hypothetical protein
MAKVPKKGKAAKKAKQQLNPDELKYVAGGALDADIKVKPPTIKH